MAREPSGSLKKSSIRNASDYYKLKAELFIALDKIDDAKLAIINYINSKVGNFISDNDPQLFKDLFYYVQDSLSENLITWAKNNLKEDEIHHLKDVLRLIPTISIFGLDAATLKAILPILPNPLIPNFNFDILFMLRC